MPLSHNVSFLKASLAKVFGDVINDPTVTELCVNPDGQVWVERAGDAAMQPFGDRLDAETLHHLAHDLAGDTPISANNPLAGSDFEDGNNLWRSQVIVSPVTENTAIAIRRNVVQHFPLGKLVSGVDMKRLREGRDSEDAAVFAAFENGTLEDFLSAAIKARWNILFSGGTSSGQDDMASGLSGARRGDRSDCDHRGCA